MNIKVKLNDIISFRYIAKGEGTLEFYDKAPLALVIDIRKENSSILCVNFHWMKPKDRLAFFTDFKELISKTEGKNHERRRLTYQLITKPKYRISINAIRMYYTKGISAFKNIPEAQWNILFGYGISHYKKRIVYKKDGYKEK